MKTRPASLDGFPSSRTASVAAGTFVRESTSNRSLERGLLVLRAFRPGTASLTTSDVAERTALPLPTVSRLLATLVRAGFLTYDFDAKGYCLGVPLLSLGHAYTEGSTLLRIALPLMSDLAHSQRVNVGLATQDGGDVVYLQSVRGNRGGPLRRILPGSRAPLELTSIGRAWLAGVPPAARQRVLREIALRYERRWPSVLRDIREGIAQVRTLGWCTSRWQAGSVGMARPLAAFNGQVYSVNITFLETSLNPGFESEQGHRLVDLVNAIERGLQGGALKPAVRT